MTPQEVRAMAVPEYLAMVKYQDEENRELKRAAAKRGRR